MRDILIITSYNMLVTGFEKKYFYIWTKAEADNIMLVTVEKDNDFLKKLTEKCDHLFQAAILPELVSWKRDVEKIETKNYIVYANDLAF